MARSLNKVQLIGNLTHSPLLKYTPQGSAVATFTVATNRQWTDGQGSKHDEAEFHRVVAWGKLAEICDQNLGHGSKVFVEGRLATRKYTNKKGIETSVTEIITDDVLFLSPKKENGTPAQEQQVEEDDIPL